MTDENKNIENNQEENQNRQEFKKKWWEKLLGLKPTYGLKKWLELNLTNVFYGIICILLFVSFTSFSLKTPENTLNDIPENGKFVEDCNASKNYTSGGIFNVGNNRYLIVGCINILDRKYYTYPLPRKMVGLEFYDNQYKKITKRSDNLLYFIIDAVQLNNGNIFIQTTDETGKNYFAIIDKNTFEINKVFSHEDLFKDQSSNIDWHFINLSKNKIVLINGLQHSTYIFDADNNTLKKAPEYNKEILDRTAIVPLDINRYIVFEGIPRYKKEHSLIEICDINKNKCFTQKSKLYQSKTLPNLFKTNDNKILIIGDKRNESNTIELFDPVNDTIEIIGQLPNDKVFSRSYTQLKDGNILITGGEKGIMFKEKVNDAYIFDVEKKELKRIKNGMKYARVRHLTGVLENGDVLICGGRLGNARCERYIYK